ncbi:MAG: hypothetical protein HXY50_10770 [Ignavibacteriaceae bacterium]|nr:hypothetical protein [Ignavibacteriaceae bacterium]
METQLKPDLGFHFLEKFGADVNHHFYSVKLFHLIHVGHNQFSFTSTAKFEDIEYAVTFDFTTIQLEELLNQLENREFSSFISNKLIKEFTSPEQVDFYDNPLITDIDAKLGKPVKSLYEMFIPFIVIKFSNVLSK